MSIYTELQQKEKAVFRRDSSFLRVWFISGLEVEKLVFYSNNKVLYETRQSWLEDEQSRQDLTQMTINKPKKALKVDLTRKDNFYIKGSRNYNFKKGYIFYINLDLENIKIEDLGLNPYYDNENEINEKYLLKMTFKNPCLRYEPYLDKNKNLQYKEIETTEIKLYNGLKTTRKERGKQADNLKVLFDELNFNVSVYDIERALNTHNIQITKK